MNYLEKTAQKNLSEIRLQIGCLIESPAFYSDMTARENLEVSRLIRNIADKRCIDEVLEQVGLTDVQNKKVKKFSLGMKQRLGIANALLGNPKFLVLDEPINGLDPLNIVKIREVLKKVNREKGTTILISSHILSELSEIATCYGIINRGKLIEEIKAKDLEKKCKQYVEIKSKDIKKVAVVLETEFNTTDFEVMPENIIKLFNCTDNIGKVNSTLVKNGIEIEKIMIKGENLEEYFINIIGGGKND